LPNLLPLEEGLIYIGLGTSLAKRCHFSGKTASHSPRRSLAALLWQQLSLEPELAANGKYGLSKPSEKRLDAWMHENLLMAFEPFDDFVSVEDILIRRYAPPLNLTKCAQSEQHDAVKELRKAMREYAISLC
jgi:predicted GIY-YIG superfamily endonuclease